jgi:Arm DNA-binding domain
MAKVSEKLTPVTIKAKAKPRAAAFKLTDGRGLYLLVNPNGSCYWRMAYRFAGLQKLLALGVHPELSLADARRAAETARASLANGILRVACRWGQIYTASGY